MQNLTPLCELLHHDGCTIQIETSGTFPIRAPGYVWVTISPKIGMPGGYPVLTECLKRANEIKFPIARFKDIERAEALEKTDDQLMWLVPVSHRPKNIELCLEACAKHGWRLSVQMHKFLEIR